MKRTTSNSVVLSLENSDSEINQLCHTPLFYTRFSKLLTLFINRRLIEKFSLVLIKGDRNISVAVFFWHHHSLEES